MLTGDVELQEGETREDQIEALHPACRRGGCTDPEEEGGLGVVVLHPVNELAMGFYQRCCELTPPLALALDDLAWHPDKALLARQIAVVVRMNGAPWLPLPSSEASAE